ncbi:hypothetical protein FPV67DRAFT_1214288 [Lyophyllum atratum]|nr:hypothetical protein FPV67DRAFT_1214288 [Lyophyllum atratum]
MRSYALLALFCFLVSFGAASPIPKGGHDKSLNEVKGRAVTPPTSRPNTPTPEHNPAVPLPGRTGSHSDGGARVVTLHYGDDKLPEHMGHLQRNQKEFPKNRNPMSLSNDSHRNRNDALHNIPAPSSHPVTGGERVRDEKMPAMLKNPHHSTSTTVEYLDRHESSESIDACFAWQSADIPFMIDKEGSHASSFKKKIQELGTSGKGQLRPNPGWLPLHPDQQRGHEAPARLGTQTIRPTSSDVKKSTTRKAAPVSDHQLGKGYTPKLQGSEMTLRKRPGKDAPPPPPPSKEKKSKDAPNNLRPGQVSPTGHVWHPSTTGRGPSHAGAPGHLPGAEQRQPPRPQNYEHHMKQVNEKKAAEEKQKHAASQAHHAPPATPKDQRAAANLAKFEKDFGPAKKGKGPGRAHEAPGRMGTHTTSHAPVRPAPHAAKGGVARPAPPPAKAPHSGPSAPPAHASGSKPPAKAPAGKGSKK